MHNIKNYTQWLNEQHLFEENIGSSKWSKSDYDELKKLQLQNLKDLIEILKKNKARFWIDCGTLLGIYRDGVLIDGDSDCDIGIFAEDITPELIEDLRDRLYAPSRMFYGADELIRNLEKDNFVKPKNLKYVMYDGDRRKMLKGVDVSCDIFIYFPNQDYRMFKYGGQEQYIRTRNEYVNKLDGVKHKGLSLKMPSNVENYLVQLYGKGWKTPDPSYDYKKENPWCLVNKDDIKGHYFYNFKTQTYEVR